MIKFNKKEKKVKLQDVIDASVSDIYDELEWRGAESEEVKKGIDNLSKLYEIKKSTKTKISDVMRDAIPAFITGGFSLLSVLVIVMYEEHGVITTKSLPFVPKGRA